RPYFRGGLIDRHVPPQGGDAHAEHQGAFFLAVGVFLHHAASFRGLDEHIVIFAKLVLADHEPDGVVVIGLPAHRGNHAKGLTLRRQALVRLTSGLDTLATSDHYGHVLAVHFLGAEDDRLKHAVRHDVED